jgi:hypothetical protein
MLTGDASGEVACYIFPMPYKSSKLPKSATVKNMSVKAKSAAKAFKGLKVAATPARLRGKKAGAIKRAVRDYYLG